MESGENVGVESKVVCDRGEHLFGKILGAPPISIRGNERDPRFLLIHHLRIACKHLFAISVLLPFTSTLIVPYDVPATKCALFRGYRVRRSTGRRIRCTRRQLYGPGRGYRCIHRSHRI